MIQAMAGRRWLAALAAIGLVGCGGNVLTPPDDGSGATGDTSTISDSTSGGGASTGTTTTKPPGCKGDLPAPIQLDHATSGTFVGGYLHISAQLAGGPEIYHVLQIAGGEGWLVNSVPGLAGSARIVRVWDPSSYARLRVEGESAFIDLIDAKEPAWPTIPKSRAVPGVVPAAWSRAMSVVSAHALVCASPAPGEDAVLTSISIFADDEEPKAVTPTPSFDQPCSGNYHDTGAAHGTTWMVWGTESDLTIYGVSPATSTHVADYYYNPDGIHQYGNVLSAATDGSRIVFDPANDSEVFLYAVGSGLPYTTHAYFGLEGPKRVLAVVDQIAYLATQKGVRAYDVSDVDAPALLDYHADADFGEGLATLIAADGERLVVTDAAGRIYLIPLGSSGAAAPLVVRDGPAPDGCTD